MTVSEIAAILTGPPLMLSVAEAYHLTPAQIRWVLEFVMNWRKEHGQ